MASKVGKNNKHGVVTRCFDRVTGLFKVIQQETMDFQNQKWKLPENRKLLEGLVGQVETDKLYAITDTKEQNIYLRKLLVAPLKDEDHTKRYRAIHWVVVNWGKIIKGKRQDLEDWVAELQNYDATTVESFIEKHGKNRISSWSKVLAFADSSKYAIYDTRVAMSLNMIFEKAGYSQRFFMPQSRSDELNDLFKNVRASIAKRYKGKRVKYLLYPDYMQLLRSFVEKYPSTNILDLEMRLFANSGRLAKEYAEKYDLKWTPSESK